MSAQSLEQEIAKRTERVNEFIDHYLSDLLLPSGKAISELRQSMRYSATNGGKRFRPVLSLLVAEALGHPVEKVLPFATAVEMIHTYSLIHDDLPCMDNDDMRRGQPTNHKVYGEAFALLAGDALLTEAFMIIGQNYPENGARLVELLAEAAGVRGMVGGQAIDLKATDKKFTLDELVHMHRLKTGALIRVAIVGAAVIANADRMQIDSLRRYGEGLGLAFQVADDVLDHGEKDQDARSFTGILGLDGTKEYLRKLSQDVRGALAHVPNASLLAHLVDYNQNRQV